MRSITAICMAFVLAGCKGDDAESTSPTSNTGTATTGTTTTTSTTRSAAETAAAADNTEKNERDRAGSALTPGDQGESEADRTITQRARQNVVGHDDLSINAKNVKIITRNGVVTLRGPVASATEKSSIVQLVKGVDGVARVDDQLEVTTDEASNMKTTRPADQR